MYALRCKVLLTQPDTVWDLVTTRPSRSGFQIWIDFEDDVTTDNELNYLFLVISGSDKKMLQEWLDTFERFGSVEQTIEIKNWDELVASHRCITSMITPELSEVHGYIRSIAKSNSERG